METKAENRTRAEWLSTLRGLAALFVFLSHVKMNISEDVLFIFGRIGVTLFFLMSGYLTYTARTRRNRKQYLFNRFVRMYPVYWVVLILVWLIYEDNKLAFGKLLANMTLFPLFLGQEIVLMPSWMMSMLICFFIIVAVDGMMVKKDIHVSFMIGLFGVGSMLSGALKCITGLPFPTAFPLLIMVAFVGVLFHFYYSELISAKILWGNLVVFECSLCIAAVLSYDNWWAYLVAYNIGFLLFAIAHRVNLKITVFILLAEISFPFFLGSGFLSGIMRHYGLYGMHEYATVADFAIKLGTDIIFSYIITKLVEKPILNRARAIEKKL